MHKKFLHYLSDFKEFIPKSAICFQEGYNRNLLKQDFFAGITVGVIAFPLAMAFAIGSGVAPEKGLFTAIVAGALISLLGGSRLQIGGPTGAFVVIVYSIIQKHGYDGLALATLLAGLLMILMGVARLGVLLKFIPYPVTTGFTSGIALVIFSSQIRDFFGLAMDSVPADFTEKWNAYAQHWNSWNPWALTVASASLLSLFALKRYAPKVPGAILVLTIVTTSVYAFEIPVETIASKFGSLPNALPSPALPTFSYEKLQAVFPDAITIALLGAIESLLSAAVADGMTGNKHRSNCELVAQGLANIGSILYGGIPATGAIARTTANIKMGAKTPMAGVFHSATLLLLLLGLAPAAGAVPMAVLAALLIYVAWNMSEAEHFLELLHGPKSDGCVLLITFLLTVFIDLTVAVQVGVILAAFLFLKRMSDTTSVQACKIILEEDRAEPELKENSLITGKLVPEEVTICEINGPFFFGVADLLNEQLRRLAVQPRVFILLMNKVPTIDATGLHALVQFNQKCKSKGIFFLISGPNIEIRKALRQIGLDKAIGERHIFGNINEALRYSESLLQPMQNALTYVR